MTLPPRVLYLHGFASAPTSRKARLFAARLPELGFQVEVPDLAEGNFSQLTISAQLKVIERLARNEPVIVIGSSLGGYLAALYAVRHPEVARLILLAPAFNFAARWTEQAGPARMAEWREKGSLNVFHYGEGRELPIGYQLFEDAADFELFPDFRQPALIFHGNHDAVVPVSYSKEFAASHPNVQLELVDSGHELTDALDKIWEGSRDFLVHALPEIR